MHQSDFVKHQTSQTLPSKIAGQQNTKPRSISLSLVLLFTLCLLSPSNAYAQNTAYTLRNGLLVEGVGGYVSEISLTLAYSQTDRTIVMLDNGLKRTFFSKNQIANEGVSTLSDLEIEILQRVNDGNGNQGHGLLMSVGKFDLNGHRTITREDPT